jgi:hypothetical protein
MAEKIIIEVNTAAPNFEGLHDITMTDLPPRRKPYLIMAPEDRIGTPHIPVDPERVVAIVESDYPDQTTANAPEDDTSRAIASNLIEFLKHEVDHGRLPNNLLPIQSGIGNIANAVIGGLSVSSTEIWSHIVTWLTGYRAGKQISRISKYGQRSCKTLFSICSTAASSTSQPQLPSDSLPRDSNASTMAGRTTIQNCSCDHSRSRTPLRSFDVSA